MKPAINIQNYEEFFLLYADGELSPAEKQAVETFVQRHPRLAEEFDMLQQMKLVPEEIVFSDKETLFRTVNEEISSDNYETKFLLYVDDELDNASKTQVETFVLQHPALQEQFMQLKQTKLEQEHILFPDKASLYRKEEKERRVFYMNWQRVAVAAVFIGLAVTVWNLVPSGRTEQGTIAANQPPIAEPAAPSIANPSVKEPVQQNETSSSPVTGFVNHESGVRTSAVPVNNEPVVNTVANNIQDKPEPIAKNEPVQNTNNTAISGQSENAIDKNNSTVTAGVISDNNERPVTKNSSEFTNVRNIQSDEQPSVNAQPAVYRELNTDTEDEKKSLYVGSIEINKDKLRGLFRKATSIFRGKAKQEEERESAPFTSATRSLR